MVVSLVLVGIGFPSAIHAGGKSSRVDNPLLVLFIIHAQKRRKGEGGIATMPGVDKIIQSIQFGLSG